MPRYFEQLFRLMMWLLSLFQLFIISNELLIFAFVISRYSVLEKFIDSSLHYIQSHIFFNSLFTLFCRSLSL